MKELYKDIVNNGLKVTPQRLAILKIMRETRNHPTAEKVHTALVKEYPAISLRTVYNTLSSFVEAGMIKNWMQIRIKSDLIPFLNLMIICIARLAIMCMT